MVQGIELILIHGKTLKVDASKLSLIFPTLNEKSLFTIYGLQLSVAETVIRLPEGTVSASFTTIGISVICPNFNSPDLTLGSTIERSPYVLEMLNCPDMLLLPWLRTLKTNLNVSPGSGMLSPFPSVLSSMTQLII